MVHTEIKSVVVGEAGVGKTSLSAYFCLGSCPTNPASTVGASFLQKRVNIANSSTNATECCLQIWDTAGQERFRALAPMYYRGAKAAVIVCDCTNMESFTRCVSWMEDLQQFAEPNCAISITGNKYDLAGSDFDMAAARVVAEKFNVPFVLTSAFTGEGVEEMFMELVGRAIDNEAAGMAAAAAATLGGGEGEGEEAKEGDTIKLGEGAPIEGDEGGGGCC